MIKGIEILIPIIISIALLTLGERKVLGSIQRRIGPNIIGYWGLLQPITDGVKLILKESIMPNKSNHYYFLIAPLATFAISLLFWGVIPLNKDIVIYDTNYSILYILAVSSISIYGIIYGGWSSNSKYAFIGTMRGISQLISYEVSIGIILISVITLNSSFNLIEIINSQIYIWNIIGLWPIFIMFIISILAETNRTPFDLLEAESELVAGFLVEYSSIIFVAFYLGEYGIILLMSTLTSILFFGYSFGKFILLIVITIIWIRATLPRLRYDQLMSLGWTKILPLSISYFITIYSIIYICQLS